jgi:spore germination protein GerM
MGLSEKRDKVRWVIFPFLFLSLVLNGRSEEYVIYFVKESGNKLYLLQTTRYFKDKEKKDVVMFLIKELIRGPTRSESRQGFITQLPKRLVIKRVYLLEKAVLGLHFDYKGLVTPEFNFFPIALAQIVFTLTELPFVNSIVIAFKGKVVTFQEGDKIFCLLNRKRNFIKRQYPKVPPD